MKHDRQKLHETLWSRTDSHGKITLVQKDFAKETGIDVFQLCRIIGEFEEEGRMKKIAARYRNVGVYVVRDPARWSAGAVPEGAGESSGTAQPASSA